MKKLKFKNRDPDFTKAIDIDPERAAYLAKLLDGIVAHASRGELRLVHLADIIGFIEDHCETEEERVWCVVIHLQWLFNHGRAVPINPNV